MCVCLLLCLFQEEAARQEFAEMVDEPLDSADAEPEHIAAVTDDVPALEERKGIDCEQAVLVAFWREGGKKGGREGGHREGGREDTEREGGRTHRGRAGGSKGERGRKQWDLSRTGVGNIQCFQKS